MQNLDNSSVSNYNGSKKYNIFKKNISIFDDINLSNMSGYSLLSSEVINSHFQTIDDKKYVKEARKTLSSTDKYIGGKISLKDGKILEDVFWNDEYVIGFHNTTEGVGQLINDNGLILTGDARHGIVSNKDTVNLDKNLRILKSKNIYNFSALLIAIPAAYKWSYGFLPIQITDDNRSLLKGEMSIIAIPKSLIDSMDEARKTSELIMYNEQTGESVINPKYVVGFFQVTPERISEFYLNEKFKDYGKLISKYDVIYNNGRLSTTKKR